MIKVICSSAETLPTILHKNDKAFSLFKNVQRDGVGTIARGMPKRLKSIGYSPNTNTWDFLQFCLSVCAADLSCIRNTSTDGWTRNIELTIGLNAPYYLASLEATYRKYA